MAASPALALAPRAGVIAGLLAAFDARAQLAPDMWDDFKRRFVTTDGRVVDDDGSTHSEGLGTALLASATVADREGFERVWGFARGLRRDDGLFSWRVQHGGRVIDANNATDGDLYIAWALARAARRFEEPRHAAEARRIARAVRSHCVRDTRHGPLLVPGRFGFDRGNHVVVNPSYWVFPAFAQFATIDPHPLWRAVSAAASELLVRARFGRRALTADWIEVESHAVAPWRERPARFGYEAIRVPLFLYWGRQLAHPLLQAFTHYAAAPAFPAWVALDSEERSNDRAPAGFEAIARLARVLPAITRAQLPRVN
ncbi:MAG TPA: glycosyl hydrolase family 8, partial [Burkholderiaceae bacterium]|nr:glycosyl hydrolase family 8 [Burkholderiaceae bacterium]